jgi:hypothetical protein
MNSNNDPARHLRDVARVLVQALMIPTLGDWTRHAACRNDKRPKGLRPDDFFPEHGTPSKRIVQFCWRCPVRASCESHAIEAKEIGIWGGTSKTGRDRTSDRRTTKPAKRARSIKLRKGKG